MKNLKTYEMFINESEWRNAIYGYPPKDSMTIKDMQKIGKEVRAKMKKLEKDGVFDNPNIKKKSKKPIRFKED